MIGFPIIIEDNPEMEFHRRLRQACPGLRLTRDPGICATYGRDWTRFRDPRPAAVAFPASTQEVSELVTAAAEHGIPLVPSGGRTGLSGGAVAARGALGSGACAGRPVVAVGAGRR